MEEETILPRVSNLVKGLFVPIPTFPSSLTKNFDAPAESWTSRDDVALVAPAPLITSLALVPEMAPDLVVPKPNVLLVSSKKS